MNVTHPAMGLKYFSSGALPQRVESSPRGAPVISSDALREAALRASWHRDHRVARRRQAWRWSLFWAWKYGCLTGVVAGPIALVLALGLQFGLFPLDGRSVASPAMTNNPGLLQTVASTPTASDAISISTYKLDLKQAMTLTDHASRAAAGSTRATALVSPSADTPSASLSGPVPSPVRLKTEHQLFLKESSP